MSADVACVMLALGEGAGSLSSRPYSSPLEGAAGNMGGGGGLLHACLGNKAKCCVVAHAAVKN